MILNLLAVFFGGAVGATIRYITGILCNKYLTSTLPIATFLVNILGCFVLGLAFAYFMNKTNINQAWKLAITVGFCGGLSTFSAMSFEMLEMLKNGNYITGIIYSIISVVICLIAVFIGFKIGKLA